MLPPGGRRQPRVDTGGVPVARRSADQRYRPGGGRQSSLGADQTLESHGLDWTTGSEFTGSARLEVSSSFCVSKVGVEEKISNYCCSLTDVNFVVLRRATCTAMRHTVPTHPSMNLGLKDEHHTYVA